MSTISCPDPYQDLPDLKRGDLVAGRFRIVEIIGRGGFSVVYRAHQEGMNRFIALKVLKPRASDDDTIVERFRREALFASQLSHPNTITLFDYGETDEGLCYIAMEYLVGYDLSEDVKYGDPIELKRVWSILTQICRSLSEAHSMGLIHRDLKPENIFVVERNDREHIKVLDFGVSKALSNFGSPDAPSLVPLTQEGTVFGTPLYMAPEQALADEITPAVDVYALGQIAYEMITGRAAYIDELSAMDIMLRQINDPPLELPHPFNDTPFFDLVRRCTIKEPEQRIADAEELLAELNAEPFLPYMDVNELPVNLRQGGAGRPMLQLPVADDEIADDRDVEEVYRWELSVLDETLDAVRESSEMRLAVIRGKPGTGRSNLLRAFLERYRNETGIRIVHRQAFLDGSGFDAGLEADLAQAASLPLRGEGIEEVNRLLGEILTAPDLPTLTEMTPIKLDSNPLSRLTSRREDFFRRLIEPFRNAAQVGTLIWGIENLENVDPLTLAFLERFIREMRVHPLPTLLVTTVHPEALVRRAGLTRYAEHIVSAPSTYARHLQLMEPGAQKPSDDLPEEAIRRLADVPSDVAVDGSYSGVSPMIPADFDFDDRELSQLAKMADGDIGEGEPDESQRPVAQALQNMAVGEPVEEPSPDERSRNARADTGQTERLELYTTAETSTVEGAPDDPTVRQAFDAVLGYLAQLDERVISRELWDFVYHRVLPFEMSRMVGVVLEFAERFGIIILTEDSIAFTDQEYASTLRDTFSERPDAQQSHAELAVLLQEYAPDPGRQDVARIVHHAVKGRDFDRAINLLLRSGDKAYGDLDLDLAREYYLQFQALIDDLSTQSPTPSIAYNPYPKVWLRVGEIQGALGEYGAAEDALQRAIRESADDEHREQAAAHKLVGDLAMAQERYQRACQYYESARDLYRQTSLARPFVASLGKIGWCSVLLGEPRRAERILLEAIDKAEKLQDLELMARFHRSMGEALTRQARFLEAIDHLEVAMEIFEQEQEHRDVINCLDELGRAHYAAAHYEASRDHYTQALAYLSTRRIQLEDSPHLGLARALAALGNLEQAEIHLVEAMSHYSTKNKPARRALVQFHLGDLYLAMGRPSIAEEHYHHVYELGEEIGHRGLAFDALIRRGYARFDDGAHDEGFAILSEAVAYGEDTEDQNRQLVARAHIIYLQLVLHQFRTQSDTFGALVEADDVDGSSEVRPQVVICDVFRVDVAMAREQLQEAGKLLSRARMNAASLGEYGVFIPIARREHELSQALGRLTDPHLGAGHALGALIPPETGDRRRNLIP